MITVDLVLAVVTVVMRGVVDRIITNVQAPVIIKSTNFVPQTSIAVCSSFLYLLYKRLKRRKRLPMSCTTQRKLKVLDGRLHHTVNSLDHVRPWRRFQRARSRENQLETTRNCLEILSQRSSICSSSSSSCKESSVTRSESFKEASSSTNSIKSVDEQKEESCNGGFGDWSSAILTTKPPRKKRTVKRSRKTRSGKVYSSYL